MPGRNHSMDSKVSFGVHDLSDEAQRALRRFIHKKHRFSEEEKATLDFNSVEAFEDFWGSTWKAKEKFGAAHNSEIRSEIQSFVSSACDIMKNLDPIVALVKDLGAPYGSLAIGTISFVFTLQEGRNNDALSKIQSLLKLETYSAESEQKLLRIYQEDIKHHFEYNWQPMFERMQGQALQSFQQGQEFQRWQNSEQSSILILVGYNNESIYNDEMCWMSPAALQTIDDMINDRQKDPFAFYIFGQRSENRFPQVLSSIIIQLLRQNRQSLQNQVKYDELYAAVQRFHELPYNQCSTQEDLVQYEDALRKVALRALDMFDSRRTVWIILDRVDRGKHARMEANHRKMLIKSMVRLVEEAKVKVKVLAVVNGWDWDAENESDDFGQIKKSSVVVHPVYQSLTEF
ncbi:hypothetical protein N7454_010954 [Penicillium verhagenii]|nr:hypothetical protein N7454_010954 [Penicillium verhagenii]